MRKHPSAPISFHESSFLSAQASSETKVREHGCIMPHTTPTVTTSMFPSLPCRECHIDNHVTERTDLPDHLIVGSQGTEIFTQELTRVNTDQEAFQTSFEPFHCNLPGLFN